MAWFKTRKGRGYGKYDYKSHGTPWPMNAPEFWAVRKDFMAKYGVEYAGRRRGRPDRPGGARSAGAGQLRRRALSVLADQYRADGLADRPTATRSPPRSPSMSTAST